MNGANKLPKIFWHNAIKKKKDKNFCFLVFCKDLFSMLSHQTLFDSYKVVPHAKQTKASSMLPGTSDISNLVACR